MKLTFSTLKKKHRSHLTLHESSLSDYTNPIREWTIGLVVAFLLLVLGATFIAFDFYKQFIATSKPVIIDQTSGGYNEKDVIFYAKQYDKQEETFNTLRKVKVVPINEPLPVPETVPESDEIKEESKKEVDSVESPIVDQPIEIGI